MFHFYLQNDMKEKNYHLLSLVHKKGLFLKYKDTLKGQFFNSNTYTFIKNSS